MAKVKPQKQESQRSSSGPNPGPGAGPGSGPAPATRRGELRREALIEAARQVFLERGYAAASIDEVVQRVGGSKASVYQYFGSKEGLFGEMIAQQCGKLLDSANYPTQATEDIEQTLLKLARRIVQLFIAPERLALSRAMIAEAERFPELAERFYESGPKRGIARLSGYLQAQQEAGVIHCENPEWAAIHFMNLVRSYPMFRALHGMSPMPRGQELDDFLRNAVQLFLDGCRRSRAGDSR